MSNVPYDTRLEHLLATAARVFAEKGYHATTMRDLARGSGMSLAGMYYYVDGKDELLFLVQERCFRAVLAGAEAAVADAEGPIDRVNRFVRHHVAFFASHMSEMKVLSHEAGSLEAQRLERIKRLKRRYVDFLTRLIGDLETGGESRSDPRLAAYALFGMMNWIYTWYDPDGPITPDVLAQQFGQLFLNGAAGAALPMAQGGTAL